MTDVVVQANTTRIVVVGSTTASPVVVDASSEVVVSPGDSADVTVSRDEFDVVLTTGGIQGPPGEDGVDGTTGENVTVTKTAGANLGGHRMVRITGGVAQYADARFEAHGDDVFGMTTGAALMGAPVAIVTYGQITEPSWTWTPEEPLFLNQDGLLTQTADPSMAFALVVGFAQTPTTILLDIDHAIFYEG